MTRILIFSDNIILASYYGWEEVFDRELYVTKRLQVVQDERTGHWTIIFNGNDYGGYSDDYTFDEIRKDMCRNNRRLNNILAFTYPGETIIIGNAERLKYM